MMDAALKRPHRIETGFPFTSLWHGIERFFAILNRAIAVRNEYSRLLGYSDAELEKLGTTRGEVAQYVAKKYF